jgi:hypothetical protein
MKYLIILSILILNFLNADIEIIASPSCNIEVINKQDIKKLFMLKKRTLSKEAIKVLNRSEKTIYKKFIKKYMNKSPRRMKTYWTRMLFTGRKIPPKKLPIKKLLALETNHSCYLSYIIDENSKPKDWNIIKVK